MADTDEPDSKGPSTEQAAGDMAAETAKNVQGCQDSGGSPKFCTKLYGQGTDMRPHGEGQPMKPAR